VNLDEAIQVYKTATEVDPAYDTVFVSLTQILLEQGKPKKELQCLMLKPSKLKSDLLKISLMLLLNEKA
jgi:predicted Zn-dependent protease